MAETVSDQTRRHITQVAMAAIREQPVSALNAQDVAAAAGVSTSAIYKAYGNKYELFAEASRRILMEQAQRMAASIDPDAPPMDRLHQLLAGAFQIGRDEPFAAAYVFCVFPIIHHGDVDPSVVEHALELRAFMIEGLRTHVADAIEAGDLQGDPHVLAEFCAIDTFGYVGRSISSHEHISPEQYADFVVAGLRNVDPRAVY